MKTKFTFEGHNIRVRDVIDSINGILPNEYNEIEISDEIAETGMTNNLNDLWKSSSLNYAQFTVSIFD